MTADPLFPPLEPYATHRLNVGDGHVLYVEESGNPAGLPALVLHGGPGSGCNEKHRQRFDPAVWRIICFDQRGAGRSTADDFLRANTTPHVVGDIEKIRALLGVEAWALVYGTSWGSTLALAYAQAYPQLVKSMVIGGIFLPDEEFAWEWFTAPAGLPLFLPNEFARVEKHVAGMRGFPMVQAIAQAGKQAMYDLIFYECMAADLAPDAALVREYLATENEQRGFQIQATYYAHRCFLEVGQTLRGCATIAHIPLHISHGLQDMVCPPLGAHMLHKALPHSTLDIVPECGHRATPAMEAVRVRAIGEMAKRLRAGA